MASHRCADLSFFQRRDPCPSPFQPHGIGHGIENNVALILIGLPFTETKMADNGTGHVSDRLFTIFWGLSSVDHSMRQSAATVNLNPSPQHTGVDNYNGCEILGYQ